MSRRYAHTYRRASTYESRAAAKIAAAEAAGIPVRTELNYKLEQSEDQAAFSACTKFSLLRNRCYD